jgi:hypothetical protein
LDRINDQKAEILATLDGVLHCQDLLGSGIALVVACVSSSVPSFKWWRLTLLYPGPNADIPSCAQAFAILISLYFTFAAFRPAAAGTKRSVLIKESVLVFQNLFILAAVICATTVFCLWSGRIYQKGYAATPISEITDSGLDLACEWRSSGRLRPSVGCNMNRPLTFEHSA